MDIPKLSSFVALGLVLGLVLGLAAPAFAAPKTSLAPTSNTIAGPGSVSIPVATSFRVFAHPTTGTDLCVTVANTGKVDVSVNVIGAQPSSTDVQPNGSRGFCSDDTTAVDIACGEDAPCSVQWRVDEN